MKIKYYLITGILALTLLLIINIPAGFVVNAIKDQIPQLKIQNVSGTLWQGSAQQITVKSKYIFKNVEWSICIAHLLLAEACVELETMYNKNPLSGQFSLDLNKVIHAKDFNTTISAHALSQFITLPMGEIAGDISLNLTSLDWDLVGIPSVNGIIEWNKASITIAETTQLGDITITLAESEDNPINAEISNQNGQIAIAGTASLNTTTDYGVDLTITPNNKASNNLKNSLGMFSKRQPNGSFVLKNSGNLKQLGLM